MKRYLFLLAITLGSLLGCKEKYSHPQYIVEEIMQHLKGTWKITQIHAVEFNDQGEIISDTVYNYIYEVEIIPANYDLSDPFNYFYVELKILKNSNVAKYFSQVFYPIPMDYSGRDYLYCDPDSYEKRIILWGIIPMGSLHLTLNREIIDKNKEKWWLFFPNGAEDGNIITSSYFEEWVLERSN